MKRLTRQCDETHVPHALILLPICLHTMRFKLLPHHRPLLLLGFIATLVGVYTLYWFVSLQRFKAEVALLTSTDPAQPFALKAEEAHFSGFPYRLEVRFVNARLTRATPDYQLQASLKHFTLLRQPWNSKRFLAFGEDVRLSLQTRIEGRLSLPVALLSNTLEASLSIRQNHVERLSLVFQDGRLPSNPLLAQELTFANLELHGRETATIAQTPPARPDDPAATKPAFIEVLLSGKALKLAESANGATLNATLALTADPKTAPGAPALTPWREAGGTLEIQRFDISGPQLRLLGELSLALDKQGRLVASGGIATNMPESVRAALAHSPVVQDEVPLKTPVREPLRAQSGQLYWADQRQRSYGILAAEPR
jgi:hypothetical protein